jgi:hypothetical protein
MLQRLDDRMNAHNIASKMADARALEHQAQHPQIMGAGRMGRRKMGLEDVRFADEETDEEEVKGGAVHPSARLNRLVGGRKKPSAKEVADKHLEAHALAHEALEGGAKYSEAYLQGGALSKHLRELHGEGFWDDFKRGFMSVIKPIASIAKPILSVVPHPAAKAAAVGLSALGLGKSRGLRDMTGGGVTDFVTGATQRGRVANPPPSFARNTVGMGMYGEGIRRHRVVESTGGEYADVATTGVRGGRVKKPRAKAGDNDARKLRGAAVSRLMKEHGMSLGEASKHIKENGF